MVYKNGSHFVIASKYVLVCPHFKGDGMFHANKVITVHVCEYPGANMGYLSEVHLKLKSCKVTHLPITYLIDDESFCTENSNDAAMLCANFQNNWTASAGVMDE